jgi:hypothetical protein
MAQGHFPENQFDEREKSFPPTVSLAQVDLGYCGSAGKGIEPLPVGQGANDATSRATVPDPSIKWLSQQLCFSTTAVMGMVCVSCQSGHIRKKRWRLTNEKTHVRQEPQCTHGGAFRLSWPNDRNNG